MELTTVQHLIVLIPPILLAITFHEVAHGWTALQFGDTTAKSQGRLSLNPLRHVDPVGTILVPAVLFLLGGFIFGWAKPVPVDYRRLRQPKRDMALVALAGPSANLAMALCWGLLMSIGIALLPSLPWIGEPLAYMGNIGVTINIVIGILNMLPVPPLDGSRVLVGLLPHAFGRLMVQLEPYGLIILLILLATGMLGAIIGPPIEWLREIIFSLFGF
jgi:Zn-dependent protease